MAIFIEKNKKVFTVFGDDVDVIQDFDLERFIKKITDEPELETAYRLGEFNFEDLNSEDREEVEKLLANAFLKSNYLEDKGEKEIFSPTSYLSRNNDYVYGDLH